MPRARACSASSGCHSRGSASASSRSRSGCAVVLQVVEPRRLRGVERLARVGLELHRVGAGVGRDVDQLARDPEVAVVVRAGLGDDVARLAGPTWRPAISNARWKPRRHGHRTGRNDRAARAGPRGARRRRRRQRRREPREGARRRPSTAWSMSASSWARQMKFEPLKSTPRLSELLLDERLRRQPGSVSFGLADRDDRPRRRAADRSPSRRARARSIAR